MPGDYLINMAPKNNNNYKRGNGHMKERATEQRTLTLKNVAILVFVIWFMGILSVNTVSYMNYVASLAKERAELEHSKNSKYAPAPMDDLAKEFLEEVINEDVKKIVDDGKPDPEKQVIQEGALHNHPHGPKKDDPHGRYVLPEMPRFGKDGQELVYLPDYFPRPVVTSQNLTEAKKEAQKLGNWTYNVDIVMASHFPLNREIPGGDARHPDCRNRVYDISKLPTISVIIPFYNEAAAFLLRTVTSILNRSPPQLLKEIILVDDKSYNADVMEPLERYLESMNTDKVILIRNQNREGLIRSRQIGIDRSTGEVLAFFDAHTEMHPGWLEPALAEIVKDHRVLVQPHFERISTDGETFPKNVSDYQNHEVFSRTTFSWDMRNAYSPLFPPDMYLDKEGHVQAYPVPTILGCGIIIHKAYFQSIGGFDMSMNLWGGENTEVPLRIWLCGEGRVVTHPCTIVYHLFRPLPYHKENTNNQIIKNQIRTAEMWMDEFSVLFYESNPNPFYLDGKDMLDMMERKKQVSEGKQCKKFSWFMQNVMPEMPIPSMESITFGPIFHDDQDGACLGVLIKTGELQIVHPKICARARLIPGFFFSLDTRGNWFHQGTGKCLYYDPKKSDYTWSDCEPSGPWRVHLANNPYAKHGLIGHADPNLDVCLSKRRPHVKAPWKITFEKCGLQPGPLFSQRFEFHYLFYRNLQRIKFFSSIRRGPPPQKKPSPKKKKVPTATLR